MEAFHNILIVDMLSDMKFVALEAQALALELLDEGIRSHFGHRLSLMGCLSSHSILPLLGGRTPPILEVDLCVI